MAKNTHEIPCPCPIEGCGMKNDSQPADAKPLSSACGCDKFKVCKISGDRKICARMAQLGFLPGSEIELICPGGSSRCMVRVKGSTVTLDQLCADNILVTPMQ